MRNDDPKDELQAWTGRHIEVEILYESGERERLSLDIVPDNAADFDRGLLGEGTPLAKAVMGRTAGSSVPYRMGDAKLVRILSVSEEIETKAEDLSERRAETIRRAVEDSDRTSTLIYASSMSNKWGEMDPKIFHPGDEAEEGSSASASDQA